MYETARKVWADASVDAVLDGQEQMILTARGDTAGQDRATDSPSRHFDIAFRLPIHGPDAVG